MFCRFKFSKRKCNFADSGSRYTESIVFSCVEISGEIQRSQMHARHTETVWRSTIFRPKHVFLFYLFIEQIQLSSRKYF